MWDRVISPRQGFRAVFFLFIIVLLLPVFSYGAIQDPASATQSQQTTVSPTGQRYTTEEFNALSDDEKKDVYFNSPQRLPEDFSAEKYMNIMHPEPQQEN